MGHYYSLGRERRTRGDSFGQFHLCYLGCRNGQQDTPGPKIIDHEFISHRDDLRIQISCLFYNIIDVTNVYSRRGREMMLSFQQTNLSIQN